MLHLKPLRGVFCISGALAEAYSDAGAPRELLHVLPDGVDLERFDSPLSKDEARRRLGLPLDPPILCHSGHLYPGRGGEEAIEALAGVPQAVLVMVGGRAEDIARLQALATRLGVAERVIFTGQVPNSAVPAYLWAADVLVMPYTSRTPTVRYMSPLKMFEYMASGRPIVATDFPVVREVLRDGETAMLVKPDSAQALREGFQRVLGNPELSRRVAAGARGAAQGYSWNARARTILSTTWPGQGR
jgi:glycosyltransferase involved in cell wall biosynthesis